MASMSVAGQIDIGLDYLLIEQVLMRSLKTTGGLTRGRGMTETQRLVWLLSSKACSEVNTVAHSSH